MASGMTGSTRTRLVNAAILAILFCGVLLLRASESLWIGHGSAPLGICLFLELLDFGLFLVTPVLAVAGLILLLMPVARQAWRITALLVMVPPLWVAAGFAVVPLEARLLDHQIQRAIARGDSLVQAIRGFEQETGAAPPDLAALVPRHIKAIPSTGLSGFPRFRYERSGDKEWTLLTGVYVRGASYARLEYRPSGTYDERYERIAGWGLEVNQ